MKIVWTCIVIWNMYYAAENFNEERYWFAAINALAALLLGSELIAGWV